MAALKGLCVLCLCVFLPTQECFQSNHTENIAVQEGHVLTLKCVGSAAEKADLQWLNPRGFVIFMNNQKVLKDRRYRLAHYSAEELSVTLSNITFGDEGLYTCLYYSHTLRSTRVHVTVLAAPAKPATETRVHEKEEMMILSCFTWGSKPPPTVTWRLDNSIEVYGKFTRYSVRACKCDSCRIRSMQDFKEGEWLYEGHTINAFEHDGKKCNTTSTLTVRAPTDKSTAECVVRHETLGSGVLRTQIDLTPIARKHDVELITVATTLVLNVTVSESTQENYTDLLNATTPFQWQTTHTKDATLNNRHSVSIQSTQEQYHIFENATPTMAWRTTNTSGATLNNRSTILRGTLPTLVIITTAQDKATVMYTTDGTKNGILLVTLVVFLIFTLLFIIQLFMMKLRKAHQTWKKENETSDQTVESNKSRSNNEENQWQNVTSQVPSCKSAICYVNECSGPLPENLQEAVDPSKCEAQDQVAETTL